MNPQNQEHLEAIQHGTNQKRQKELDSMTEEQKHKFEVVEQAVKLLTDNGIFFYLLPMLYSSEEKKEVVWQWNSTVALAEFDEKGVVTKESADKNGLFHSCMMASLFHMFTDNKIDETDKTYMEIQKEKWDYFGAFLYHCLFNAAQYRLGPIENSENNNEN